MVWITADQSQINLDVSPVRMLTMATTHVVYSYYTTVVLMYSERVITKTIKALTYVRTIQKLKNSFVPIKILGAAYLLLLFRRKKKRSLKHSHGPKTPPVARVFISF